MWRSKSNSMLLEQEKIALERERIALYREKILLERARLERDTPLRFVDHARGGGGGGGKAKNQPPPLAYEPAYASETSKFPPRPAPPAPIRGGGASSTAVIPQAAVIVSQGEQQEEDMAPKASFRLRSRAPSQSSFRRLPALSSSFRSAAAASELNTSEFSVVNDTQHESQKRLQVSICEDDDDGDDNDAAVEEEKQEEPEAVPVLAPFEAEEEMKTVTIVLQVPKSCQVSVREGV